MNWDDPVERFNLIERVGPQEYNRLFAEHQKASVLSVVGGHEIRPVTCRFGKLYQVGETRTAFASIAEAEKYATDNPIAAVDPT